MKHSFTRLLFLVIGLLFFLLPSAEAQRTKAPRAASGQPGFMRGSQAPSTCSSCYAKRATVGTNGTNSAKKTPSSLRAANKLTAVSGAAAAYVRSVNLPWGNGDNTNVNAMDEVFGLDTWDNLFLEYTTAEAVFSPSRKFVFLDGSDVGTPAFTSFVAANLPAIENWVAAGGHLFLNAAPNTGGNIEFGFGGVTLNYNAGPYITAATVVAGHRIATGPFEPAGESFGGDFLAHGTVSGEGLASVMESADGVVLATKEWGSGHVFFGSMTISSFQLPAENAHNLRKNILAYFPICTSLVLTVPEQLVVSNTPGQCSATVELQASATDGAQVTFSLDGSPIDASYVFPVGTTTVTARASNACGTEEKSFVVEVRDTEAPVAAAQDVTITLGENGMATLTPETIDNGSTDNCGIRSITLSKSSFSCENAGENEVTLTIEDNHGNVSTATATVTVVGVNSSATILATMPGNQVVSNSSGQCGALLPFQATASGSASISYSINGSPVSSPYLFPLGTTTVTVTAANACGSESKTFTVQVKDAEAPVALARTVSVGLNAAGQASISAADINNGSTDNCGIQSVTINKTSFGCPNLGPNTIILTVTDINGNVATAEATVTVTSGAATTPLFTTVPANISINNQAGKCGASATFKATTTGATSLVYSIGGTAITSPCFFPVGTTTVTMTARNACAAQIKTFTVKVRDAEAPVARTRNISVTLNAAGEANISAADINCGSTDNCGIQSITLSKSNFTCQNLCWNSVTLTVTDVHGNVSTAKGNVYVNKSPVAAAITATPSSKVYTGGKSNYLYLGYGAKSLTLTASGGVSYKWNPVAGLSSTTAAAPVFTPTKSGTYCFTVKAINAYGCQSSASITVQVIDVRCGSKILMCHNGQEIYVLPSAVDGHLRSHGDQLGGCPSRCNTLVAADTSLEPMFEAYPNPVAANSTLNFRVTQPGQARLEVYNALGQMVTFLPAVEARVGQEYQLPLLGKDLQSGMYTCRLLLDGKVYTQRVVVSQ